jgi:hypothetical protein
LKGIRRTDCKGKLFGVLLKNGEQYISRMLWRVGKCPGSPAWHLCLRAMVHPACSEEDKAEEVEDVVFGES